MKCLRSQRGLSLIEFMMALLIGLFLLSALIGIFINANDSAKRRSTSERLDEVARQVMNRLEYDLYNAGYIDPFSNATVAQAAFDVANPQIGAIYLRQVANLPADVTQATLLGKATGGAMVPLLGCNNDSYSNLPDVSRLANCGSNAYSRRQSIQMSYQNFAPAGVESVVNSARSLTLRQQEQDDSFSGAGNDCAGNKIVDLNGFVVNRYSLQNSSGITSFGCISSVNNGTGTQRWQPIVGGVEEMTFRYLMTPPDETPRNEEIDIRRVVSGLSVIDYLPSNMVNDPNTSRLQWAGVVGVEVCLIVAVEPADGKRETAVQLTQTRIPSCERKDRNAITSDAAFVDDAVRQAGDRRFYKRYLQTISMPNSLYISQQ